MVHRVAEKLPGKFSGRTKFHRLSGKRILETDLFRQKLQGAGKVIFTLWQQHRVKAIIADLAAQQGQVEPQLMVFPGQWC